MREIPTIVALAVALAATPAAAEDAPTLPSPETQVENAVTDFMNAIASDDKTMLARFMEPAGLIFIHNQMDPDNPRVDTVPVAQHLQRWAGRTGDYEEIMRHDHVLVSGDMAQVWGPYSFTANGTLTHCGVNSISLVQNAQGAWKVANTSFSMVDPTRCGEVGADWIADGAEPDLAGEEQAVLGAVRAWLDAFIARDIDTFTALTRPEGVQFIVATDRGPTSVRAVTNLEDIESLAQSGPEYAEKLWDAEVRIRGDLAQVWSPYAFDIDGARSHCGIDSFTLIRNEDVWQMANASWTVEPVASCKELGEPE